MGPVLFDALLPGSAAPLSGSLCWSLVRQSPERNHVSGAQPTVGGSACYEGMVGI